jgi:small subunit ribosomal protein S9
MADEPQDQNPEQPEGEQPEPEQPEAEEPRAEEPAAEAPAEEPPAEEPPAEEPPAEEPPAEEPPADEPPAATPPAQEPTAEAPAEAEAAGGAQEVVPGAELDPIAIEPERELSAEERARLEAEAEERARLEAEATAEGEEPVARRGPQVELPADAHIQATGKRKSSIARVVVRAGSGGFEVNQRALDEYFPRPYLRSLARQPLVTAGYEDSVDVKVRVHGGGIAGQAGAVRHGIARALTEIDPELRGELKRRGLLTRDARRKERRKAGLKKARKRPQFSKR